MKAWRVQEGAPSSVLPHPPPPPRPTEHSRSAKLLIIQAINLHPLNPAAPSLSPSDCSNGGTPRPQTPRFHDWPPRLGALTCTFGRRKSRNSGYLDSVRPTRVRFDERDQSRGLTAVEFTAERKRAAVEVNNFGKGGKESKRLRP